MYLTGQRNASHDHGQWKNNQDGNWPVTFGVAQSPDHRAFRSYLLPYCIVFSPKWLWTRNSESNTDQKQNISILLIHCPDRFNARFLRLKSRLTGEYPYI
jgi:hypothetical protein